LFSQLVSKIFNLCGHDPPTSQTDGQTDDMRLQDRALHYSASHGNKKKHTHTSYAQYHDNHGRFVSLHFSVSVCSQHENYENKKTSLRTVDAQAETGSQHEGE